MGAMVSQITSLTIGYSTVYSGTGQRKPQSSASLGFVRWIHRWSVNSPHKWPVTRKMFPVDDVIMQEGEIWGICCESEVWPTFTIFNVLILQLFMSYLCKFLCFLCSTLVIFLHYTFAFFYVLHLQFAMFYLGNFLFSTFAIIMQNAKSWYNGTCPNETRKVFFKIT